MGGWVASWGDYVEVVELSPTRPRSEKAFNVHWGSAVGSAVHIYNPKEMLSYSNWQQPRQMHHAAK